MFLAFCELCSCNLTFLSLLFSAKLDQSSTDGTILMRFREKNQDKLELGIAIGGQVNAKR